MLYCALKICVRIACDGGHRGGEPGAVQVVGAGRVPGGRGGLLGVHQHVGGVVLDGLEGADGAAELLADLGVLDGHLQGRPADADRLGRRQDPEHGAGLACGAAKHAVLGHRHAAQRDRPDAAGGVQRVQRGDRDTVGRRVDDDDVLTGDDHQHIGVRRAQHGRALAGDDQVRADRDAARQAKRTDRTAIGEARK